MRRSQRIKKKDDDSNYFWICVSDVMANLIFVFIIILGVFSLQFQKEQDNLIKKQSYLKAPLKLRNELLKKLQKHLLDLNIEVSIIPEEGILRLSENALRFPSGKAEPEAESMMSVGHLARTLTFFLPCLSQSNFAPDNLYDTYLLPKWCPKDYSKEDRIKNCENFHQISMIDTVMIEGHTDSFAVKPGTSYEDNLALSAARAATVLRLLKSCDPKIDQLYNSRLMPLIGVSGYSFMRPIIKTNPADEKNRRIDIRFIMHSPEVYSKKTNAKGLKH